MGRIRILLVLIGLILVGGCQLITPISYPKPYTQNNVKVEVTGRYRAGYLYTMGLSGIATNLSDDPLSMCTISFDVLDKEGIKVASASTMPMSVKPHQKWKFQATFNTIFSVNFSKVEPGNVTSFPGLVGSGVAQNASNMLSMLTSAPPDMLFPPEYIDTKNGIHITLDDGQQNTANLILGRGFSGKVTNVSGKDLQDVKIIFDIYDGENVKRSESMAFAKTLKKGSVWRFTVTPEIPKDCKVIDIRQGAISCSE